MRRNWMLLGIALLAMVLAIGAVACSDDEDEEPTATEVADDVPVALPSGETNTVIVTDGILTDSAGNTLYIFDNDDAGVSNCNDACVDVWPPLVRVDADPTAGEGVDGTLSVISREDGAAQVTINDQPLYYYLNDDAPGDRNGDNVGGVWHIVVIGSAD